MAWTDREWIHTGRMRTATNIGMLGTLLAGCIGGLSHPVGDTNGDDVELGLAALMEDGPLPPTMQPPPTMPEVPPRFCTDPFAPPEVGVPGVSLPPGATLPIAGARAVPVTGTTVSTPPAADGGVPVSTASSGPVTLPPAAGSGMTPAPLAGAGGSSSEPTIDPSCAGVPIGFWTFDDCNTFRTDLTDSSFQGHTAFRSVEAACSLGQQGQAITFATKDDLVYAPDQPDFALDHGVTIAAWLKPAAMDGTRTVFRKRDDANSAIALLVNANKFQFVVRLTSGKIASVSAPAPAGTWTHVAATYDGTDLRLYLNGSEAAYRHAPGVLARGTGPLLIGNDAAGRRFEGKIDSAWFNTLAAPPDIIMQLTCLEQDPLVTLEPKVGPAVEPGTLVHYTLSVTSQNEAKCAPQSIVSFVLPSDQSFTAEPQFSNFSLASGQTRTLDIGIASGDETEAGTYPFSIQTSLQTGGFGFPIPFGSPVAVGTASTTSSTSVTVVQEIGSAGSAAGDAGSASTPPGDGDTGGTRIGTVEVTAQYVVAEPLGCHVASQRELMIRDLSVVEDPVRTTFVAGDEQAGVWSFGRLMERLSRAATDAPAVTEAMFRTFLTEQVVNTFAIQARPPMEELVLRPWPRTADGQLDLARAPLRLLTIVNRLDLKDLTKHKAGEGRFVYGVLDSFGNPTEFTVIFEYALPANSEEDVRAWENAVHALQALPFPSEAYNQALQTITDRFSGRDVLPDMPNGSALIDIRTNEIVLSREGIWQLREFHISPTTGFMDPAPLFQTPDFSFNNSAVLGRFINANEATILTETHEAPLLFEGAPFQTGGVFNNIDFWNAPGITNPEARHKFSLNTCNGCHGQETQTAFLQVQPRSQGQISALSGFLTGETVFDPVTGAQRRLGELKRRRQLLEAVVCAEAQP